MEANDREMVLMREARNANKRITQTHKNITNMFTTYNLAIDEFKKRMTTEYICYKDPAKDLTIIQNQINKVNIQFYQPHSSMVIWGRILFLLHLGTFSFL